MSFASLPAPITLAAVFALQPALLDENMAEHKSRNTPFVYGSMEDGGTS